MIELLIVIALMAILSTLAVPVSIKFYRTQLVSEAQGTLVDVLTRARQNAVLQKYDSRYGVWIEDLDSPGTLETFTLYKGASFDEVGRDDDYDEVYPQLEGLLISVDGTSDLDSGDINFAKLTGETSATGTITITHASGGESRSLTIDDFGTVNLE